MKGLRLGARLFEPQHPPFPHCCESQTRAPYGIRRHGWGPRAFSFPRVHWCKCSIRLMLGVQITPSAMSEVTRILNSIEHGDAKAADALLPLVYQELRRLAAQKMAREAPGHTLQPTA